MSASGGAFTRAWNRFFFTGASPESLGLLRIFIGAGLLPFHVMQFASMRRLEVGGPHFHFTDPIWYFRLLGVEALDPLGVFLVFGVLMAATLAFTLGIRARTAVVVMLLSIFYLKGMRDSIAGDVHHRYLIPTHLLFFFLLSRCGDVLSLDARRARRLGAAPPPLTEWQASWPIKASQLYIASFYLWSGIAKVRMGGFSWATTSRIQDLLISRANRFGMESESFGNVLAVQLSQHPALCQALGVATYVFELGFPLILLIPGVWWRLAFFAGVTFFHVANYVLIDVKFLFLPVVFPVFFDLSGLAAWWRARRGGAPHADG